MKGRLYIAPLLIIIASLICIGVCIIMHESNKDQIIYEYRQSEAVDDAANTTTKFVLEQNSPLLEEETENEGHGTGSQTSELEDIVDDLNKTAAKEPILDP